MKKIMILIVALLLVSCNDVNNASDVTTTEEVFTKEMLETYNGENGNPSYIAIDGIVYDVSDISSWMTPHANQFLPGKDYSDEINQSPHGISKLKNLPIVGTYEE